MAVTAVIGTTCTKIAGPNPRRKCVHIAALGATHALYISFSKTELDTFGYTRGFEIGVTGSKVLTYKGAIYGICLDATGGYSLIEEEEDPL